MARSWVSRIRSSSVSLNDQGRWRPARPVSDRTIRRVLRKVRERASGKNNKGASLIDLLFVLTSPIWLTALVLLWAVAWMLWLGVGATLLFVRIFWNPRAGKVS